MAPRNTLQMEHQRDFGGGLNLKDDPYNLAEDESFDLQNVDIDRRGGFGLRRGTRHWIEVEPSRVVTATGASRTANVVTAVGLSPLNGDPGGLVPGQRITVNFVDNGYDGSFVVATAVGGASTATWSQVAADDAVAGPGTIVESFGQPDSGYTYVDNSLVRHQLIARGGNVKRWDGATWQNVIATISGGVGRTMFVEFRNVLYLLPPGNNVPFTWTGTGSATQLVTAAGNYNDDLTAPNAGNYPQTRSVATHKEVMWAGGVVEAAGVVHDSRLRWSHPGAGQDWRTNDFIDIDPDDENGKINALVPFGDRLLVFKDKAIYAVHGDPPAGLSVQNLTKELGTPTQWSVVATEEMIYFWDVDKGAWRYNGKSFEWIFEPIYRLIDDGKVNVQFSFQTIMQYHRDRLWVSVPMSAPPYAGQFISLVFQPSAGKNGAWTLHTATLFGWWIHRGSDGGDLHLIGGRTDGTGATYVYELDVEDLFEDVVEVQPPALHLVGSAVPTDAATTPDAAQHDITTDIEIQFDAYRDNWQVVSSNFEVLASKYQAVAGGRSWAFSLGDGGLLSIRWSTDGTALQAPMEATAPVPIDRGRLAVKVTLDVDNGAAGRTATFFYKLPNIADWTQLGDPVVVGGTTSIFNSSSPMTVGSCIDAGGLTAAVIGGHDPFTGEVHELIVKNGIDGTVIANPDFDSQTVLTPQFTDASGLVWTPVAGAYIAYYTSHRPIIAWYTTRWFDAKNSAMKKRWKRPVVVMRAGSDQVTVVEVLRDYDPTRVFKQFEFITGADEVTGVWDEASSDWDAVQWAADITLGGEKSVALRGAPLSGGVARALRFKNTSQGQDWRIHGLTMKWIPRRVRN